MPAMHIFWTVCGLTLAGASCAQVFTHKDHADHFEATVTPDRVVVKERYRGASTIYGDLSCPLGPSVRATVLRLAGDGRLCLTFSKQSCGYTRFQDGNAIHKDELAGSDKPRMCIALASLHEAEKFAALVNSGPQAGPPTGGAALSSVPLSAQTASVQPAVAPSQRTEGAARVVTVAPIKANLPSASPQAQLPKLSGSTGALAPAVSSTAAPPAKQVVAARTAEGSAGAQATGAKGSVSPAQPRGLEREAGAGRWTTSWFTIRLGGNPRLAERTYASASIVDDAGAAKAPGGHLYIRNESDKYPLYYGLRRAATDKLEPGEEVILSLTATQSVPQAPITQHSVVLKWFDEPAEEGAKVTRRN